MKTFVFSAIGLTKHQLVRKTFVYFSLAVFGIAVFLFVLFRYLHFSTNSAVLYVLKNSSGFHITTDVSFDEVDSLLFRIDATGFFNKIFESVAASTDSPVIDVHFDESSGKGVIKDFRPDGSRLEIALSRFDEEGVTPHGIIIGGDFPPGDSGMVREGGGMAFYDGSKWIHLWCTANEGIGVVNGGPIYEPHKWGYISGGVIKKNFREVIVGSKHEVFLLGNPVFIERRLHLRAGDDFATLMIRITNTGKRTVAYDYAYGDEPWVGVYGSSEGEVGWYEEGIITHESYIDPLRYTVVGYADFGNRAADEYEKYSGYANFIQWLSPTPSQVYFSNSFYTVKERVLDSKDNRVLNVVWKNQYLQPDESKTYLLRVGFVHPRKNLFEESRILAKK